MITPRNNFNLVEDSYKDEVWKPIENYERYLVSQYGRLISCYKNSNIYVLIKQQFDDKGYCRIILHKRINGKEIIKRIKIHRIVGEYFIPKIEGKYFLNHKDGNKSNNFVGNLEWCTFNENMDHAYRNGLIDNRGEKHGMSKLKEVDVLKIRELYDNGMIQRNIMRKFNICACTAHNIVHRKSWKWLK